MPRIQRLIINDEAALYHAWGVESNPPRFLRFNHRML